LTVAVVEADFQVGLRKLAMPFTLNVNEKSTTVDVPADTYHRGTEVRPLNFSVSQRLGGTWL
jgi:hypothetical protein